MAKSLRHIAEIAIARYERLIARAEAKGLAVWELKAELKALKADLATHAPATHVETPHTEPVPAHKELAFEKRLKDTVDEDTVLPDGKKSKENKDRDLNIPQKPAGSQWLEAGGIPKGTTYEEGKDAN